MPDNPFAQFDTNSPPPADTPNAPAANPFAQFAPPTVSPPPPSGMSPPPPPPPAPDVPEQTPVPIYMRDNPGLTPTPTAAARRNIPAVTAEQQRARVPEADLGDWLLYGSGLSFLTEGLPGLVDPRAARRARDRQARIAASLTGANAERGVGESTTPVTRLSNGQVPDLGQTIGALISDPEYRRRYLADESANADTGLALFLDQNEEHQASAVRHNYPQSQFRRDGRGFLQFRFNPQSEWSYINRPGVSGNDAINTAAVLEKYTPAARISALPRTLLGRLMVAGATGAGTEYAAQETARGHGGPGASGADVVNAGVGSMVGQGVWDVGKGVVPAIINRVRRMAGMPDRPASPLPDPAPAGGSRSPPPPPPAAPARTDTATRGTAADIAALEDELAALRARGPAMGPDITDPTSVRRGTASGELNLNEPDRIRDRQAREQWSHDIDALEGRLRTAREPYFTPDAAPPAPRPAFQNGPSDTAFNRVWSILRGRAVPQDAADPLVMHTESRLEGGAGMRNAEGAIQGSTGFQIPQDASNAEFTHTRSAQGIVSRLADAIRKGRGTFRNVEVARQTLRGLEEQATGRDAEAVRLLLLGMDDWTNAALTHPGVAIHAQADISDALNGTRAAWLNRQQALMPPESAPAPTPGARQPAQPPPAPPASRQTVRDAFDRNHIPASRGQVSQDVPARQREDDLIQSGETAALRFVDDQAEAIRRRGSDIATRGAPSLTSTVDEAGNVLRGEIQTQFNRLDELADDTYTEAFQHLTEQRVPMAEAERLGAITEDRLVHGGGSRNEAGFNDNDTGFRPDNTAEMPLLRRAQTIINSLRERIEGGALNFTAVERARQSLNGIASGAHGTDGEAVRLVRHGFDEWLTEALSRGQTARIFTAADAETQAAAQQGRLRAAQLIQDARDIWSERQRLFSGGRGDPGGTAVERIRDPATEMTGTQVINSIFGSGRAPPLAAVGALRRIMAASHDTVASGRLAETGTVTDAARAFADPRGQLTPAVQALREAFWARIMEPMLKRRPGTLVPARAMAENLDRALNGPGTALTQMMHAPGEIAQMRDLLQVLKYVERPIGVNTSGTAITAARMLQGSVDGLSRGLTGMPAFMLRRTIALLTGGTVELGKKVAAHRAFSRPALEVDFGRSPSGSAFGQLTRNQRSTRESDDPDARRPVSEQTPDPMRGITDITSAAAGTATFKDGPQGQWVTIPTIVNGQSVPVYAAIEAWRRGTTRAIAAAGTQDEALVGARSYRSQPATVP